MHKFKGNLAFGYNIYCIIEKDILLDSVFEKQPEFVEIVRYIHLMNAIFYSNIFDNPI